MRRTDHPTVLKIFLPLRMFREQVQSIRIHDHRFPHSLRMGKIKFCFPCTFLRLSKSWSDHHNVAPVHCINPCFVAASIICKHRLRKKRLQWNAIFLIRQDLDHPGSGSEGALCTEIRCPAHSFASGNDKNLAKRTLVPIRGAQRKLLEIFFLKCRFPCRKIRILVDADICYNNFSRKIFAWIKTQACFTECKRHRQIRTKCDSKLSARVAAYPGRQIYRHFPCRNLVQSLNDFSVFSFDRAVKPNAEDGIYYSSIFSCCQVIHQRNLIILCDLKLAACFLCAVIRISEHIDFRVISMQMQDPGDRDSVSAVVPASADAQDPLFL